MSKRPTTTRKAAKAPPVTRARTQRATVANASSVTIRHYCQGIGDCHLLRFPRENGGEFFMLIDCGVHSSVTGGNGKIAQIVADIASVTKRIDVLVLTHEHWDHISGFATAADEFAKIDIGDVWLAWTENPRDRQGKELDKYKGEALAALQTARNRLTGAGLGAQLSAIGEGLASLLGFHFGAKGEKVRDARDAAVGMATGEVIYHEPGAGPLSLPGVSGVNVYVLGPPRDAKLLGLTERKSEMYGDRVAFRSPMARALAIGFGMGAGGVSAEDDFDSPFDPEIGSSLADSLKAAGDNAGKHEPPVVALLRKHYVGQTPAPSSDAREQQPDLRPRDQSWRRIDQDWLAVSADLAMQLDNRTNNTSLVLAFEFADTKRVLLFTADAQAGNWLSWQDVTFGAGDGAVTGPELLARTVYLKVGHHGSRNATLRAKGLECMTEPDLSAFVPVNEQDAKKVRWGQMPFKDILDHLETRTNARVIRADQDWVQTGPIPAKFHQPSGAIKAVRQKPGLWVELEVG